MFIKLLFNVKGPFPQQGNTPPSLGFQSCLVHTLLDFTHAYVGIWLILIVIWLMLFLIWLMLIVIWLMLIQAYTYYIPTWISVMRIWHVHIFPSLKKRKSQGPAVVELHWYLR